MQDRKLRELIAEIKVRKSNLSAGKILPVD
jgi:hypothetical protein